MRTSPVRLGPVECGVNDENTTMLPARAGTATASSGSRRQTKPMSEYSWARVPRRCSPGTTHGHPFSSVASVSATQQVRYCCGSTNAYPLSWCQGNGDSVPGFL